MARRGLKSPACLVTILLVLGVRAEAGTLFFEANRGQAPARVRFLARAPGYTLWLTPDEALLSLGRGRTSPSLSMRLAGARRSVEPKAIEALAGKVNLFLGKDPGRWLRAIPTYARIEQRGVYRGVDLIYQAGTQGIEYDLVVRPGGDPRVIALEFRGTDRLAMTEHGDLLLAVDGGVVRHMRPCVYQEIDGKRREIEGRYRQLKKRRVGFEVGAYDHTRALVIDPVLGYSTYLGGTGGSYNEEIGKGIAVDTAGSATVVGFTKSTDFPTASPAQPATGGGTDVFVTRFDATGTALVYSTYLGGSGTDEGLSVAVDAGGNAYVAGRTESLDFPVKGTVVQPGFGGGVDDGFVVKLDPTGQVVYATYLGGISYDRTRGIAVDGTGNAYVTGDTQSSDFPTRLPYQATYHGAFVSKIDPAGANLVYSTYLGGSGGDVGNAIAVDSTGSAYVAGYSGSPDFPTLNAAQPVADTMPDAFVTKFDASGSALMYSTFLGGNAADVGLGIAVDAAGAAYVTGDTDSSNFPTRSPYQGVYGDFGDAFVTKLASDGSFAWSTFLGGSAIDRGHAIAVGSGGTAYVTGYTQSQDFPIVSQLDPATPPLVPGECCSLYLTKFDASGTTLAHSSLVTPAYAYGIAVDGSDNTYLTGYTGGNLPTRVPFQPALAGIEDAFVMKVVPTVDVEPRASNTAPMPAAPVNFTFRVHNDLLATAQAVLSTTVFDPCLALAGFDPVAMPAQVAVSAPSTVTWTPALRKLEVAFTNPFSPGDQQTITVSGIVAGAPTPQCCTGANITHQADQNGFTASTCIIIRCPVPPSSMTGLKAVRRLQDVDLVWDVASDAATVSYDVWKVVSEDKTLIPSANLATSLSMPTAVIAACPLGVPRATPSCSDPGAISTVPPSLAFYQVLGVCADGVEGPL